MNITRQSVITTLGRMANRFKFMQVTMDVHSKETVELSGWQFLNDEQRALMEKEIRTVITSINTMRLIVLGDYADQTDDDTDPEVLLDEWIMHLEQSIRKPG